MIAKKTSGIRTLFPERPSLSSPARKQQSEATLLASPVQLMVGRHPEEWIE
jgi:hypothetical protein